MLAGQHGRGKLLHVPVEAKVEVWAEVEVPTQAVEPPFPNSARASLVDLG